MREGTEKSYNQIAVCRDPNPSRSGRRSPPPTLVLGHSIDLASLTLRVVKFASEQPIACDVLGFALEELDFHLHDGVSILID